MLPALVPSGLDGPDILPEGIHAATPEEIHDRFVGGFPESRRRRQLYDSWLAFSDQLRSLVPVEHEFIDGSFVTGTGEPKDVDASFWVPRVEIDGLGWLQERVFSGLWDSRLRRGIDGYLVMRCEAGDSGYADYRYWKRRTEEAWPRYRLWDRSFAGGLRKGYVEVSR